MKRKMQEKSKPCSVCGKPTNLKVKGSCEYICDDCYIEYRDKHEDDGYMTEADYQTWGRV